MPSTKPWSRLRAELERNVGHEQRARAADEKAQGEIEAYHASLAQLRRARQLTQTQLAKTLGKPQPEISRIERQTDVLVSTLRSYVEAMGGELELVARFPGQPEVRLHLDELTGEPEDAHDREAIA
ncbi:MAG: XRE family transcriptional regulator [Egibacteraceae bacterium]